MRRWFWVSVILVFLSPFEGDASMKSYNEDGKIFAEINKLTKPTDATFTKVPGFEGTKIPESKYHKYKDKQLEHKISEALLTSKEGSFVKESFDTRPKFDIDPLTDSLILNSESIVDDPHEVLKIQKTELEEQDGEKTYHQCERGQDTYERKCIRRRVPKKIGERDVDITERVNIKIEDVTKGRVISVEHMDMYPLLVFKGCVMAQGFFFYEDIDPKDPQLLDSFKTILPKVDSITGKQIDIDVNTIQSVKGAGHDGVFPKSIMLRDKRAEKNPVKNLSYDVTYIKKEATYELDWIDDCSELEALADDGKCDYGESRCIEPGSTKMVDGISLNADCWAEERIYRFKSTIQDTCKSLLEKGCVQISSKCLAYEGNDCIRWGQTFECSTGTRRLGKVVFSGTSPFCLDGDCVSQEWAPNADMADSLSKLAIFQQIQKDVDGESKLIFNGKKKRCSRTAANFKDCCTTKGWGMDVGLASCKQKEKELAEDRKRHRCIRIGTYCAKQEAGICLQKKTTFCCYASRLAKIINEQGKRKLRIGFGTPKHPNCVGLTLDQLIQLDFSQIDLSELFEDLMANLKIPSAKKINEEIQKSMDNQTYMNTDKQKGITQGREKGDF